jgi:hypothetical protein
MRKTTASELELAWAELTHALPAAQRVALEAEFGVVPHAGERFALLVRELGKARELAQRWEKSCRGDKRC